MFPRIEYCIVCEDARAEVGNKVSILGFYGIAPEADVFVSNLVQPAKLLFLFGASGGEGHFMAIGRLLLPDGTTLADANISGNLSPNGKAIVGFGFGLPLRQAGRFGIQLRQGDEVKYETSFNVHEGFPS